MKQPITAILILCGFTLLLAQTQAQESTRVAELREEVGQLRKQIEEVEAKCTPPKGTLRTAVERQFGQGRPTWPGPSKIQPGGDPPTDSPRRFYPFSEKGDLVVIYDGTWRVNRAYYTDPNGVAGRALEVDERANLLTMRGDLRQRLAQMNEILVLYVARFEPRGQAEGKK